MNINCLLSFFTRFSSDKTAYTIRALFFVLCWGATLLLAAPLPVQASSPAAASAEPPVLEPVAFSKDQWTGVAVSREGRLFVNYPRWSDNVPVSVAEIIDGWAVPYPNTSMNTWLPENDPASSFVCVQAVFIDTANRLWILDPANPSFQGVIEGGPKLIQVDLATNTIVRTYHFDATIASKQSYLNDVRIDIAHNTAYITDSGAGALIVLDLATGTARRLLTQHASTKSEDVVLTIGKRPWLLDATPPRVHADGIAYDARNDMVYYQALTGRTMYRIPGTALRTKDLSDDALAKHIQTVGVTGASDGLLFGSDGKVYISALEHDAVLRTTPEGTVETVITNSAISWPDSFSLGPDNMLYFTTSRIHEGADPQDKYGIYRIILTK